MCTAAALVLTKDKVFWSKTSNSHLVIIRENRLHADGVRGPNLVEVEITPPGSDYSIPLEGWKYSVTQDVLPDWYDQERDERRAREALKEWSKYHCCTQEGDYEATQLAGYMATQKARHASHQRAGELATQTAGNWSVQEALDYSVQMAGDCSLQVAKGFGQQTGEANVVQVATSNAKQTGRWDCRQLAAAYSVQKAGQRAVQCAAYMARQEAGEGAWQKGDERSVQVAGPNSVQIAGDHSTQSAGEYSVQVVGDKSMQLAGVGTVQVAQWCDTFGKRKSAMRMVTEVEADKWYRVEGGVWSECVAPKNLFSDKGLDGVDKNVSNGEEARS